MDLLGGHPYLARRALYLVAGQHLAAEALFANASDARGPFGDHLRYHLYRVQGQADLVEGLHQVLNSNARLDESVFFRLRGAGLIRERGHAVVPRCALYARFFQEYLRG